MTIISDEEKPFSETKYVRERSDKFIVTYCPKTSDKRRWQMKSKRDQHVVLDNKRLSTAVTSETKRILEAFPGVLPHVLEFFGSWITA
jgi:hypothetical protein